MSTVAIAMPEPPGHTQHIQLEAAVFGSLATVSITDYGHSNPFGKNGPADSTVVQFELPEWSGRRSKAEALDGIAALRVLLASAEAALRANDAPPGEGE